MVLREDSEFAEESKCVNISVEHALLEEIVCAPCSPLTKDFVMNILKMLPSPRREEPLDRAKELKDIGDR